VPPPRAGRASGPRTGACSRRRGPPWPGACWRGWSTWPAPGRHGGEPSAVNAVETLDELIAVHLVTPDPLVVVSIIAF
jgi:hypothetical protein